METMDVADHAHAMITMYAPDTPSGRIVATHCCAAGNQPRMAARDRALIVRFQDADHFQQLWTSREGGKESTGTFAYVRKK